MIDNHSLFTHLAPSALKIRIFLWCVKLTRQILQWCVNQNFKASKFWMILEIFNASNWRIKQNPYFQVCILFKMISPNFDVSISYCLLIFIFIVFQARWRCLKRTGLEKKGHLEKLKQRHLFYQISWKRHKYRKNWEKE